MAVLGDRIKELRQSKGLSLRELADICGTSKSAISMYERGERRPKYETLEAIADYFDVKTDYLLGKSNDKRSVKAGKRYGRTIIETIETWRKSHDLTKEEMEKTLDWENMYDDLKTGRYLASEDLLFIVQNMLKALEAIPEYKKEGKEREDSELVEFATDSGTDNLYKKISMLDDEDKGRVDGFLSGLLAANKYRGEEQTYQIKIAARGGGVKEITLTESQMAAILNAPEVTDLGSDDA